MKNLVFTTMLTLLPADLARGAEPDVPVLEIVTFRLNPGVDTGDFLNAAKGTEAMLRERGALIRRFLTVDDDALWTDVIEWRSLGEALAAAEEVMQHPDFAPFASMADPNSITMRHAPILWRME